MINISNKSTHIEVTCWVLLQEKNEDEPPLCNFVGTLKNKIYNKFLEYSPTSFIKFSLDALKESRKSYLKIEIYNIESPFLDEKIIEIFDDMQTTYDYIFFKNNLSKK